MSEGNQHIKDKTYPFSTLIPVRITDINYGRHLGHMATIGLCHQARLLFLHHYGFSEMDVEGLGMILLNLSYEFKRESHFNDVLNIHVAIGDYSKSKFTFLYKAINAENGMETMSSQEEFSFFNYDKGKISRMPPSFIELCKKNRIEKV
ncbi:MAG: thioesterase family protein [Gammaproteobacteria bacterium]